VVERALLPQYAGLVPYVAALVALAEDPGVRIVTRIVDVAADELVADMDVEVVFRPISFEDPSKSVVVPLFVPAGMAVAGGTSAKLEAGRFS
jgi:uncharacterized OB-fold protein